MKRHAQDMGRTVKLLKDVSPQVYRSLMRDACITDYERRATIFPQGTTLAQICILLQGKGELFGRLHAKRATLLLIRPGDAFELSAVVRNAPALTAARMIEPSQVLLINAEAFRASLRTDAELACAVTRMLAAQVCEAIRHLRNIRLLSAKQRIVVHLLRLYHQQGCANRIRLDVSKATLASLLGLEPPSLSRALSQLRAEGVETEADHVVISDVERLRASCNPGSAAWMMNE